MAIDLVGSLDLDLDPRGAPLYRQIADHFRREIGAGRLPAGSRLPPIRALARALRVNRDTVATAYEELAGAGLVESTVGRGTFVCPPRRDPVSEWLARPFQPALAGAVERLLEFESARPRFVSTRDTVAFHALVPDPSLYPVTEFQRALDRALAGGGAELLTYGGPQGHRGLREVLAERFAAHGMRVDPGDVVLCQGASQGIALAVRLFAEPGDAVALEEPTYNNVQGTVSSLGLKVAPIPTGAGGLDLDVLEHTLARPDVKALYTIPTFHNPLGTSTPVEHRRTLLEIAARHQKPVIEDAYEMDLGFEGAPPPPLAALEENGLVVHLFSFSKSLFPGARVGSIAARGRIVDALLAMRNATDLGGSLLLQAALAELVRSGDYDRHLERVHRTLRGRRDALLDALEREMPAGVRFTRPRGGCQVWVELPSQLDSRDVLSDSQRAGVLFAPGHQFNHDRRPSPGLRLTVAAVDEAAIRRGIRTLAAIVRERLAAQAPGRVSAAPV